tara:strand:+ start:24 stop:230 length:207 start_codon:yes stop_codon:yes gene_type:complete
MAVTKVTLKAGGVDYVTDIAHAERILSSGNNKCFNTHVLADDKYIFDGSRITKRRSNKGTGEESKVSE